LPLAGGRAHRNIEGGPIPRIAPQPPSGGAAGVSEQDAAIQDSQRFGDEVGRIPAEERPRRAQAA
jgi:hypothetical protein